MNIDTLSFGLPAAERDDDLLACFVESDSYNRVVSKGHNVILGNRGTGKSAIFKKAAEDWKKKKDIVISLAPDEFSYEMMARVLESEAKGAWAKHGAYSVAWKYLIYIQTFKELANRGIFKTGKAAKLYNYVRDTVKDYDRNPIGLLISFLKRMEGIKIGKHEAALKTRELDRLYKLEEISGLVEILDEATAGTKVMVLVDELDKGWDASEDAKGFVSGLFSAAMAINARHKNLRILISLRRELYDNIPELYDDYQKISDTVERITWNEDSLLEFVARRIEKWDPSVGKQNFQSQWNKVFSEKLSYRLTNSFNYIIDRTLFRPREIIQFANDIAQEARSKRRGLPLDYDSIAGAEGHYSESRLNDIAAEYKHQYPGLIGLFETFRGLRYNMPKEEFQRHLLSVACGEYTLATEAKKWTEDPEQLIKVLWEVGFIKAQVVGGIKAQRRSGSDWLGSYQISGINISNMSQYQVHPMFRSFLGMKESIRAKTK
jgi:hypothetical protein